MFFSLDDTTGNKVWDLVGHLLHNPTKEQIDCQHPKPILLDTGLLCTTINQLCTCTCIMNSCTISF